MDAMRGSQHHQDDLFFDGLLESEAVSAPPSPLIHKPRAPLASVSNNLRAPSFSITAGKPRRSAFAEHSSISGTTAAGLAGQPCSAATRVFSKQPRRSNLMRRPPSKSAAPAPAPGIKLPAVSAAAETPVASLAVFKPSSRPLPSGSNRTVDFQLHWSSEPHTTAALSAINHPALQPTAPASKSFRRRSNSTVEAATTTAAHAATATAGAAGERSRHNSLLADLQRFAEQQSVLPGHVASVAAPAASVEGLPQPTEKHKQPQQELPGQSSHLRLCVRAAQDRTSDTQQQQQQQQHEEGQQPQKELKLTANLFATASTDNDTARNAASAAVGSCALSATATAPRLGSLPVLPLGSAAARDKQHKERAELQQQPAGMLAARGQVAVAQQQISRQQRRGPSTGTTAASLLARVAIATAMPTRESLTASNTSTVAHADAAKAVPIAGNTAAAAAGGQESKLRLPLLPLPTAAHMHKRATCEGCVASLLAPLGGAAEGAPAVRYRSAAAVSDESHQPRLVCASEAAADTEPGMGRQQGTLQHKLQLQQQLMPQVPQQGKQGSKSAHLAYKARSSSSSSIGCSGPDSELHPPAAACRNQALNNTLQHQEYCKQQAKRPRTRGPSDTDSSSSSSIEQNQPDSEIDAAPSSSSHIDSDSVSCSTSDSDGSEDSGSLWTGGGSAAAAARHSSSSNNDKASDSEPSWSVGKCRAAERNAAERQRKGVAGTRAAGQLKRTTTAAKATAAAAKNLSAAGNLQTASVQQQQQQQQEQQSAKQAADRQHHLQRLKLPQLGQHASLACHPAASAAGLLVAAAAGVCFSGSRELSAAAAAVLHHGAPGAAHGEVPVLLPSAAALSRQKVLLVEIPGCLDVTGDSGAIGRVVCSRNPAAAAAGTASDTAAAAVLRGSIAKNVSRGEATGKARSKSSKAAREKATFVADAGDRQAEFHAGDQHAGSGSDSDGDMAQQLADLLEGRASKGMAASDCETEQQSATSDDDRDMSASEEEVKADEEAAVTDICLDLKGCVFATEVLPLAGTAAVVRINIQGNKSKEGIAHVEHVFNSSFVRASAGAADQQQLDDDLAAFEFEDDNDNDCCAAAAAATWFAGGADKDQQQQRKGKGSSKLACRKGKGGSTRSNRAGGATAARGTAVAGVSALGVAVSGKRKPRSKGPKASSRNAARGAATKARALAATKVGVVVAAAAGGGGAGGVGRSNAGPAAKKHKRLEPWEVSDGGESD